MKSYSFGFAALLGAVTLILAQTSPVTAPAKPASSQAKTSAAQSTPEKPVLKGFPFTNESLSYTANWPSGISLGEAHLSATASSTSWRFELGLEAGIPGFTVKDTYQGT